MVCSTGNLSSPANEGCGEPTGLSQFYIQVRKDVDNLLTWGSTVFRRGSISG